MGVTIINNHPLKLKSSWVRRVVKSVLELLDVDGSLSLVFVDSNEIREYNKKFRGVDRDTDVISFPSGDGKDYLGDIIICLDVVRENAEDYGVPLEEELARVIIHGILHLLGYRDYEPEEKEVMEKEQERILALIQDSVKAGRGCLKK